MSFDALAWAAKARLTRSTDKLVLLGLAECADRETHEAYPSIAALVEFSSLNRKTVIASLDRLEADGFIISTGEHKGRTAQIKVYRLAVATVPKTEQSQKRNSPVISAKQSQKRDTEQVREPRSEAKASSPRAKSLNFEVPDWIPRKPWDAFVEMRAKTGSRMTDHAKGLAVGELEKLKAEGSDPAAVLNQSIMKSWRGLFPVKGAQGRSTGSEHDIYSAAARFAA